jgi:hypothetical protein
MRPGVSTTTPPEVMDATTAEVSMETDLAFKAAHSSPFAKVPVCTMATDPGAGVVMTFVPSSSAAYKVQEPLPSFDGVNRALRQASDCPCALRSEH